MDDDIGPSGHVSLQIVQKTYHLGRGGGHWRRVVGHDSHSDDVSANKIQNTADLTMPKTPTDPFDNLGDVSTSLAVSFPCVGPTLGRLCDMLNADCEVEPIRHTVSCTRTGGSPSDRGPSAPSLGMVTGVAGVAPNPRSALCNCRVGEFASAGTLLMATCSSSLLI